MRLFMFLAIADSLYYSNAFFTYAVCRIKLPQLMSYTVFWSHPTIEVQHYSLFQQYQGSLFFECFGLFLNMACNFCLIFDLVIMIKQPFSDKSKFMTKYQWGSILSAFIVSTYWVTGQWYQSGIYWSFQVFLIVIYLFGFYSIIEAWRVLSRPGISGSARTLILRRHATGIFIFQVCNIYYLAFSIYKCYMIPLDVETTPWWQVVLKASFLTQGVLGPLIRCNE